MTSGGRDGGASGSQDGTTSGTQDGTTSGSRDGVASEARDGVTPGSRNGETAGSRDRSRPGGTRRQSQDVGGERRARHGRGQLSLPLVEAGIGVVLILGLAALLALGTPAPQAGDPQLDAYAADVATVLAQEPASHGGTTRLDEVSRSPRGFEREAPALRQRVDALLPDSLLFRIEVAVDGGARTIGFSRPAGAVTGAATVTTRHGRVRIEVWRP